MSFASALNSYCNKLGCTNRELAARCGLSASALSRYRSGERTPNADSAIVERLAFGIAQLARERAIVEIANPDEVKRTFDMNLVQPDDATFGFGQRLDTLLGIIGMGNREAALLLSLDPSYIYRIRKGLRQPSDIEEFSHRVAAMVVERANAVHSLDYVLALTGDAVGARGDRQRRSYTSDELDLTCMKVYAWLQGQVSTLYDTTRTRLILQYLNDFDPSDYHLFDGKPVVQGQCYGNLPANREFFGVDELRQSMIEFLWRCVEADVSHVNLRGGMPFLISDNSSGFVEQRNQALKALSLQGTKIVALHDLECSLSETIARINLWLPLYMTGCVSSYTVNGMHNTLYSSLGFSSDACVLVADSVSDYPDTCWGYLTSNSEAIAFQKMRSDRIMEMASPVMRVYREDDEKGMAEYRAFLADLETKTVRIGHAWAEYENLRVDVYPYDCAVVTRIVDPVVHCVMYHPMMCRALYLR